MRRPIKVGHMRIHAIGRDGVLDEVVGTDREEIHFRRNEVRAERGGRHFDHDAHREI